MANIISSGQQSISYWTPTRKLKNSVASSGADGSANFDAEAADIPDKFATTESPKLKFLFSVQFYPRSLSFSGGNGSTNMNELIYPLKRASRPNITMNYQPINQYNYRTAVLTKIEYNATPASLTFYDDTANRSLDLIVKYLKSISPIANRPLNAASSLGSDVDTDASVGTGHGIYGPLEAIRVAHHQFNPSDPTQLISTYYDYLNPKISQITLDDLDMTASEVSTVEFSFAYDSVNITEATSTGSSNADPNASHADPDNTNVNSSNGVSTLPTAYSGTDNTSFDSTLTTSSFIINQSVANPSVQYPVGTNNTFTGNGGSFNGGGASGDW